MSKNITVIDREGKPQLELVAGEGGFNAVRTAYDTEFLLNAGSYKVRIYDGLNAGETYTLPPLEQNPRASLPEISSDQWQYTTPGPDVANERHVRFEDEGGDRKKSKFSSPGARLDEADLRMDNILNVALDVYRDQLSSIGVPECPFHEPELGRFTRAQMGHTMGRIDTRLTKSFDDATPGGKELCDNLRTGLNVVLLGKSGCGKTSAIFDAAHKFYCVLFTASAPDTKMASKQDPGGFDYSFSQLVQAVTICLTDKKTNEEEKEQTCNVLFEALIVARLLMLLYFQGLDGASSQLWLVYQLQDETSKIAEDLFQSLARRSMQTLQTLRARIVTKLSYFFYAFDEAQVGYKLLQDKQRIWTSSTTEERRGVGSGFVRRLAVEPNAVVIAGTALSLGYANSILSDIGKGDKTMIMRDFPALSLGEIKEKLKDSLDLNDVQLGAIPSLWKLEGRGRLFGGLFLVLFQTIRNGDGGKKSLILEAAVNDHYAESLSKLEQRIKNSFPTTKEPIMRGEQRPTGLCKLAIASLWGGTVSFSSTEFDQDLLHVGLCSVKKARPPPGGRAGRKPPLANDYFILDEQLGREAIQNVAQEHQAFVNAFSDVLGFCRPAAGHAMEPLFVGELRRWCERTRDSEKRDLYVIDFLRKLFGANLPDLPSWVNTAPFRVEGAYDRNSYVSHGLKDDIDFVIKAIGDPKFRNRLLSPSTVKRPDFEAVMGEGDTSTNWFLSASSKLYSSVYDDTSGADLRSTDPTLFYCKKDGEENNSCRNLRRRWKEVNGGHNKTLFERCLRIHLCLPDVKQSREEEQYIWVDGESVILYITAENASDLFQAEIIKVLKGFGYLRD